MRYSFLCVETIMKYEFDSLPRCSPYSHMILGLVGNAVSQQVLE
jgi:hypothetical protein